jgi:hypothetical protein
MERISSFFLIGYAQRSRTSFFNTCIKKNYLLISSHNLEPRFRVNVLAQQAIHSYNGTLLWKIESYQRKRQDAIDGVKTALYSPPFYTTGSAHFGFKMFSKIYKNRDGFG